LANQQTPWEIDDYSQKPPFASFLPGIAGPTGIPLWIFYVNRGQGISSFGANNKDHSIIEFQPANKAYQSVFSNGFRTFIKLANRPEKPFYESFSQQEAEDQPVTKMLIDYNSVEYHSYNPISEIETRVQYYLLPSEKFGGLVRELTLINKSGRTLRGEFLDGLSAIIPDGVPDRLSKDMSNTVLAWMQVELTEDWLPFYRVSASIEDRPEVKFQTSGHFYISGMESGGEWKWLKAIVDPQLIFGLTGSSLIPENFVNYSLAELYNTPQIKCGRQPCGFFGSTFQLVAGEKLTLHNVIGNTPDLDLVRSQQIKFSKTEFWQAKFEEARQLTSAITDSINTESANPIFDRYCRHTYLDNVLRGGMPQLLSKEKDSIYYLYSRKHGDLERDYNYFSLVPEFFSTGNGNYRDINQNRRCDPWFDPAVYDTNIKTFMNLLQTDGYNPLEYRGQKFQVLQKTLKDLKKLVDNPACLEAMVSQPVTPGKLLQDLNASGANLLVPATEFVGKLISGSKRIEQAMHLEGYWIDHWSYNLDLIDQFLALFPDREYQLLFADKDYSFFDSAIKVKPRYRKYHFRDGKIRQLEALEIDQEHQIRISNRSDNPHLVRTNFGKGQPYATTLFVKLYVLVIVKFATMDPAGIGVEMEANKPGWCDALNGLPSLFGSSTSETYEIRRLLKYLLAVLRRNPKHDSIDIPKEIAELAAAIEQYLDQWEKNSNDFHYWDQVSTARENYRARTRLGLDGAEATIKATTLIRQMEQFSEKVQIGIDKALELGNGLPATYLSFEPVLKSKATNSTASDGSNAENRILDKITGFTHSALPVFLEALVKNLRTSNGPETAQTFHRKVRNSPVYDSKLSMYRLNANIKSESSEIGRLHAFPRGWLENEAIFLHMHYKYLLALLQSGCHQEFWDSAAPGLVPFLDPAVYGRSTMENVSFIVSSVHPALDFHGRGLVARLSGSTAEFLDIWRRIMIGNRPFSVNDNQLTFRIAPALPGWLFKADGQLNFTFLGFTKVSMINPNRADIFPGLKPSPEKIVLTTVDEQMIELQSDTIPDPWATKLRNRQIESMDIYFSS